MLSFRRKTFARVDMLADSRRWKMHAQIPYHSLGVGCSQAIIFSHPQPLVVVQAVPTSSQGFGTIDPGSGTQPCESQERPAFSIARSFSTSICRVETGFPGVETGCLETFLARSQDYGVC